MIPNQTIIDNMSAEDIINIDIKVLKELESGRRDQIRNGAR